MRTVASYSHCAILEGQQAKEQVTVTNFIPTRGGLLLPTELNLHVSNGFPLSYGRLRTRCLNTLAYDHTGHETSPVRVPEHGLQCLRQSLEGEHCQRLQSYCAVDTALDREQRYKMQLPPPQQQQQQPTMAAFNPYTQHFVPPQGTMQPPQYPPPSNVPGMYQPHLAPGYVQHTNPHESSYSTSGSYFDMEYENTNHSPSSEHELEVLSSDSGGAADGQRRPSQTKRGSASSAAAGKDGKKKPRITLARGGACVACRGRKL